MDIIASKFPSFFPASALSLNSSIVLYKLSKVMQVTADLAPRIQRLRQRQGQLHAARWELENLLSDKKVELADKATVMECVDDLKNMLEESTITERKSFIKSFIREVRVTGAEVSLSYSPPLLSGMMSRETVLVHSIVHDGGQ